MGIIERNVSTLPFVFVAFGTLLISGGIYRLISRKKLVAEHNRAQDLTG
jgi:hypothetical protein